MGITKNPIAQLSLEGDAYHVMMLGDGERLNPPIEGRPEAKLSFASFSKLPRKYVSTVILNERREPLWEVPKAEFERVIGEANEAGKEVGT